MNIRVGLENLKLAKELAIAADDVRVLARVYEILSETDHNVALGLQDECELKASYLKAKYVRQSRLAERDYYVVRGQQRNVYRDDFTSGRGKVDEGLSDYVESEVVDARDKREQSAALADLLWGTKDTVFGRRRTLEEMSYKARKD